jgi:hypothetical protein
MNCPICGNESCSKKTIEHSLFRIECPKCMVFLVSEEILYYYFDDLLKKKNREAISEGVRLHNQTGEKSLQIVLSHSQKPIDGVEEKTVSELEAEGKEVLEKS